MINLTDVATVFDQLSALIRNPPVDPPVEPPKPMPLVINAAGLQIIKDSEGCELTAYPDPGAGIWTIGWGHTFGVVQGQVITQMQADALLVQDIMSFQNGVKMATASAKTTENQFSAMVSLCYNIGLPNFLGSTVLRQHNAGNYPAAADAFALWNKGGGKVLPGLVARRVKEQTLYMKGD